MKDKKTDWLVYLGFAAILIALMCALIYAGAKGGDGKSLSKTFFSPSLGEPIPHGNLAHVPSVSPYFGGRGEAIAYSSLAVYNEHDKWVEHRAPNKMGIWEKKEKTFSFDTFDNVGIETEELNVPYNSFAPDMTKEETRKEIVDNLGNGVIFIPTYTGYGGYVDKCKRKHAPIECEETYTETETIVSVPEPSPLWLVGVGLALTFCLRRRSLQRV